MFRMFYGGYLSSLEGMENPTVSGKVPVNLKPQWEAQSQLVLKGIP